MRKLIIYFSCLMAVLLAGYVGYRGFRVWKQKHGLEMARSFLAKSDGRNALLSLQQVLSVNPANLEANRLMARMNDVLGSQASLIWWSRVVALNPKSTDDRLSLAQTALAYHYYATATNALDGIDAAGKQTAAYHNLAGATAAAVNDFAGAEMHFLAAQQLDPTNQVPQLNLSVVLLHGSNALAQAQARATLDRIAADPKAPSLRCQALRELLSDAMHNKQMSTAVTLSQQLVNSTNSTFEDRLMRLDVLLASGSGEFKPTLAAFQGEAARDPKKISELGTWQLMHNTAADALAWLQTLPKEMLASQAVMLISAECRAALQDWRGLQASLEKQNWAELDFIRHAYLLRALRGQGLTAAGAGEWELALKAANVPSQGYAKRESEEKKRRLLMLLSLVDQWKFSSEAQNLLSTIVNQYPEDRRAYEALSRTLLASGQTRPLMILFSQESKRSPSDLTLKNNVAMLALLLDAQELKPHDLAQEVYQKSPTNSSYASTYAFSLYVKKKNAEALAVMEKLSVKQLEDPSVAGYYGLILKANGNAAKAKTYLELSTKANLLPEERKLMNAGRAGV